MGVIDVEPQEPDSHATTRILIRTRARNVFWIENDAMNRLLLTMHNHPTECSMFSEPSYDTILNTLKYPSCIHHRRPEMTDPHQPSEHQVIKPRVDKLAFEIRCTIKVECGANQRKMRESLRGIAQLLTRSRDLL